MTFGKLVRHSLELALTGATAATVFAACMIPPAFAATHPAGAAVVTPTISAIETSTALTTSEMPSTGGRTWHIGRVWHPAYDGEAHGPSPCPESSPFDTVDSISVSYGTDGEAAEGGYNDIVLSSNAAGAKAGVDGWVSVLYQCMVKKPFPAPQGDYWLNNLKQTTVDGVQVFTWDFGTRSDPTVDFSYVAFVIQRDNVDDFVSLKTGTPFSPVTTADIGPTIAAVQRHLDALS